MNLNLSKIPNSKEDISLPEKITDNLAEETGLHIGDGTMNFYKIRKKIKGSYALRGHRFDDRLHYEKIIKPLYQKLYNLNISLRDMPSTGVFGFQKWSDSLVNFKKDILKLPLGKKINIQIPNQFILKPSLTLSVIRGIFDTDGTLYLEPKRGKLYPRIEIGTISKNLADQLFHLINKLDIRATNYSYVPKIANWHIVYKISVRGEHMLNKWIQKVSPHNPKHLQKYQYFIDHS